MPKTKPAITDITVGGSKHDKPRYWLGCTYDGAIYHVWIDAETHQPQEPVLYKNPPRHLKNGDEGFYWTRSLDLNGATGRKLLPAMLAARDEQGLVQQWRDRMAAEEAAAQREDEERAAAERIMDAAPQLVAALVRIRTGRLSPNIADRLNDTEMARIAHEALTEAGAGGSLSRADLAILTI